VRTHCVPVYTTVLYKCVGCMVCKCPHNTGALCATECRIRSWSVTHDAHLLRDLLVPSHCVIPYHASYLCWWDILRAYSLRITRTRSGHCTETRTVWTQGMRPGGCTDSCDHMYAAFNHTVHMVYTSRIITLTTCPCTWPDSGMLV
jgi:hypothetical protein